MKVKVYSPNSKASNSLEVSPGVFDVKESQKLLTQAVQTQLANLRRPVAHTKDRGEVSGGGRKPFRQKGTGRARAGSIRSPLWRGGGVVFGPKNLRNYSKRFPQKMARKALLMVLSEKLRQGKLIVVGKFRPAFGGIATSQMQDFLEKLPIEEGKILLVLAKTDANLELSTANLPYAKTILVSGVNLLDLLNYDYLVTDKEGIKSIEKQFSRESK